MAHQSVSRHDADRFHRQRQAVPYKYNGNRRHQFTQSKYKVTHWPEYNEAWRRRGDITIWFSEEAINPSRASRNQKG